MSTEPGGGHDGSLEYHQRMLADPHRVSAYDRALRALVAPGASVLDAGAGTGFLSMLAARAGAGRVFAVESMSIAALARMLVEHNGLGDRVEVIQADLRTLAPRAEVDLIVSDCLGRFLVDDHMMHAMEAAFRWLRPGGRVIPSSVTLRVAPVALGHFSTVDGFSVPLLGIDLTPAEQLAEHAAWGAELAAEAVLAPAQDFATWALPGPPPLFDQTFVFTFMRPGRLRGVAGWFRAELAPEVVLETAPGLETHWDQLLLPLPATRVEAGDRLELRLYLESDAPSSDPMWRRTGNIITARGPRPFDLRVGVNHPEVTSRWRTPEGADSGPSAIRSATSSAAALNELGADTWVNGEHARARRLFEDAVMALGPEDDEPGLWENLGIARHADGNYSSAIAPLLRALDGDLTSREQSLRLLVDACMRSQRQVDGARYLALYEAAFGPHPAEWRRP